MVPLNIGSDVFILVVFVCLHKRKSAFDISIKTKSHKTNQTCCWTSLELISAFSLQYNHTGTKPGTNVVKSNGDSYENVNEWTTK